NLLIYAGSLVNPELVQRSPAAEKYDSNGMSLEEMTPLMVQAAQEGKTVVRLHSGDPALYGAIIEQMELLKVEGIAVEVVPGVSSLFGAAAALQTQLTLRGVSESVIITRPAGKTLGQDHISDYSRHHETMAIFLGSDRLSEVTAKVRHPTHTPAVVIFHATWPDQLIIRGTVEDIAQKAHDAGVNRSALLLIGEVFGEELPGHIRSELYS
ncbi:MAG: cobalt-precorrin-4/precorrin-4 C(11)-methyltransferase, partial [Methanospirillum sp.]|uniref:cobalt-precorrin-4/precorrin-4 C(11)-methyltransferase n=1 Tax=Methanospirillum sp. TaxID=45200 RepID=UPI002375B5C4